MGSKSFVETNWAGTAIPMSPGHTALFKINLLVKDDRGENTYLSLFAPSTIIGPATPRVASFSQAVSYGGISTELYDVGEGAYIQQQQKGLFCLY